MDDRPQTTNNEVVAQLKKLTLGEAGHNARAQLRERYLAAFRAAWNTNNTPSVIYLNGWWEIGGGFHCRRARTDEFIKMILRLEERVHDRQANDPVTEP